jgi:hypothetical protein
MIKKTFAAAGVAGLLVLGVASAAHAEPYPATVSVTADDVTLTPGQATVVTALNVDGGVVFETTGPGVSPNTLTSISFASVNATDTAEKVADENRTARATFTAPTVGGTYVIIATDEDGDRDSVTVTVAAATSGGSGSGGSGSLPATGGDAVPAAAVWLGAGAVGLGGIAVTAAVARRRAASTR